MSARDINITSRQSTSTLTNSQLVLLDGRSIYLDFFGIVLWDFLPTNLNDIQQIEVIRGPASAVWGANALTGVVNVITKSPREAPGTTSRSPAAGSAATPDRRSARAPERSSAPTPRLAGAERAAGRTASRPATSTPIRFRGRPARIPLIQDPRDPAATVGGAAYPDDGDRRHRHGVRESWDEPAQVRRARRPGDRRRADHVCRRHRRHRRASSTPASGRSTSRRARTWGTRR